MIEAVVTMRPNGRRSPQVEMVVSYTQADMEKALADAALRETEDARGVWSGSWSASTQLREVDAGR